MLYILDERCLVKFVRFQIVDNNSYAEVFRSKLRCLWVNKIDESKKKENHNMNDNATEFLSVKLFPNHSIARL